VTNAEEKLPVGLQDSESRENTVDRLVPRQLKESELVSELSTVKQDVNSMIYEMPKDD
jgi:hypothetical protein